MATGASGTEYAPVSRTRVGVQIAPQTDAQKAAAAKYGLTYNPADGTYSAKNPYSGTMTIVPGPDANGVFTVPSSYNPTDQNYATDALIAAGVPKDLISRPDPTSATGYSTVAANPGGTVTGGNILGEGSPGFAPGQGDTVGGGVFGDKVQKAGSAVGRAIDNAIGTPPIITIPDIPGFTGGGSGPAYQSPVDAAAAAAANANKFSGLYDAYQPGSAPVAAFTPAQQQAAIQAAEIARTQLGSAALAAAPGPISAGTASAGTATAQQIAGTALAAAAQIDPVTGVRHTTVGPTALGTDTAIAPVALGDRTALDTAAQAEMRAQQQGLIGNLQGTIAGTSPSLAALMLRQETERNVANQYALAQASNGMNAGMAQRQAMMNAGDISQQAIGQKAMLRAQEIATAQGQLGTLLQGARGTDVDVAGQQAQLDQQRILTNAGFTNTQNMTQAQLTQALKLANAGFKNTATTTQAQLDAAEASQNAKAANDRSTAQAGLTQQASITNAGALNDTSKTNATLGTQTSIANAGNQTQASIATAGNLTDANKTSAQLAAQVGIANANNQTQTTLTQGQIDAARALAQAQNQLSADSTSAQLANQVAIANSSNQTQTNLGNATNQLTQAQIDAKARQDLAANAIASQGQATGAQTSANQIAAEIERERMRADAAKQVAIIGGVSSGIAALGDAVSDRRAKKNIKGADVEIAEFMSKLKPSSYRYKDLDMPGTAEGERFGIMAQDLERSKVGRSLVMDTPTGKRINSTQAVGAILATLSAMNKRLDGVEGRA